MRWAKKNKDWKIQQWSQVLFTDESKFEIFRGNRRQYVCHLIGECMIKQCVIPTVKHGGGSVMVWGGIVGNKVGDLAQIEDIMDKKKIPQHSPKTYISVRKKNCG